jgi:hypothetical protein
MESTMRQNKDVLCPGYAARSSVTDRLRMRYLQNRVLPVHVQLLGGMLWLMRKMLCGSYFDFAACSRW